MQKNDRRAIAGASFRVPDIQQAGATSPPLSHHTRSLGVEQLDDGIADTFVGGNPPRVGDRDGERL